jgi:hypothetical protein
MIVIASHNGKAHLTDLLVNLESINLLGLDVSIIDTQSNELDTIEFLDSIAKTNPYNYTIHVHKTPYRGFDTGAYIYAINNIKADKFFFIQDSIRIKRQDFFKVIDNKLKLGTAVNLIQFNTNLYDSQEQKSFCQNAFNQVKYSKGVFGPMFSIYAEDIKRIKSDHLIYPINKMQQMGMERGWAILFDIYGITLDSLEGDYNFEMLVNDKYKYFKKLFNKRK